LTTKKQELSTAIMFDNESERN